MKKSKRKPVKPARIHRGVSMPASLLARIQDLALKEKRSVNSLIGILLDGACSRYEQA